MIHYCNLYTQGFEIISGKNLEFLFWECLLASMSFVHAATTRNVRFHLPRMLYSYSEGLGGFWQCSLVMRLGIFLDLNIDGKAQMTYPFRLPQFSHAFAILCKSPHSSFFIGSTISPRFSFTSVCNASNQ